ncbi:MAG: CheR family methyltransferase [Planctomycetaceae bacterium]
MDHVLTPEEIPLVIAAHAARNCDPSPRLTIPNITGIDAIFKLLRDEYGIDFSYYKPNTIGRRIERRRTLRNANDIDHYVETLRADPAELNALYRDLLIGVTRFFRDKDAFDRLEKEVLPDLIANKKPEEELRVWVAGCATGEEAYSIAILIDERLKLMGRSPNVKIFATDVHRTSLEFASAGVFSQESLEQVTPSRLERYFTRRNDGYHVTTELRQMVVFAVHNIIKDAPFTKLDLISCRNMLIYFQPPVQKKVISLFHFGLRTGGVLFLGPSETPGEIAGEFEDLDQHWRIYRKRRDIRLPPDMRLPLSAASVQIRTVGPAHPGSGFDPTMISAYDYLLDKFMPPGLLINDRRQLMHSFGEAARFLSVRPGRATTDVLDMLSEDLKLPLAGAIQRVIKDHHPVVYSGVRVRTAARDECVNITVEPVLNRHSNLTHLLIFLAGEKVAPKPAEPTNVGADEASRDLLSSLESELHHTRENLQATVEELETSNEEMQATNEELVASNEELQSTNEELHSVNEELYTVNAEYQKKITELTELTDDMDNLLRSTDVGTIFLDQNLCIRKFTPQIGRAFNLLPQDIGRRIDSFSHNIQYDSLLEDVRNVLKTETPIERNVEDRHGASLLLRILPYRSHSALAGVVVTLIDVTSLKQSQERVAALSAIVESSDDAIVGMTLDGRITTWNRGAEELYGYSSDEVLGQSLTMLRPESERHEGPFDWTPDVIQRMRDGLPAAFRAEVRRQRKDGKLIDVALTLSAIRGGHGTLIGISKIARDISDRKQVERDLQQKADEIARANADLQASMILQRAAEERAREGVELRDRFLAMLSHELRNPLAAILNATRLHQEGVLDQESHEYSTGVILRQSEQMARLLDDLLDVSRITRNKIEIRKQVFDLRDATRDAVEAVGPLARARAHRFHVSLPDEKVCVDGDSTRLQQIQVNLLANAVKYTPQGGDIWTTLEVEDDEAVIRVRDNGIGIPHSMQEEIFEIFVQLDRSSGSSDGGMGVGLTLVRNLVGLHGGTVTAHSNGPGRGAEFVVRLPLASDEPAERLPESPARILNGRRVLIVDDNADIRVTSRSLLEARGCTVSDAADGQSAIQKVQTEKPEIALIDIGMPGIDGYETARQIKQLPDIDGMLLIAVTGFGQADDRITALNAGFDAHLVKPINLDQLSQVIENLSK